MKRIRAELEAAEWVSICNTSFVAFRRSLGGVANARSMLIFVSSTLSIGLESLVREQAADKTSDDAAVLRKRPNSSKAGR